MPHLHPSEVDFLSSPHWKLARHAECCDLDGVNSVLESLGDQASVTEGRIFYGLSTTSYRDLKQSHVVVPISESPGSNNANKTAFLDPLPSHADYRKGIIEITDRLV